VEFERNEMAEKIEMPEGYTHEPSGSAFVDHIGQIHRRSSRDASGQDIVLMAVRVEPHHVNSWGFAHGAFMAGMAEIGCAAAAWEPGGPPVVAIEMSMQFIGSPRLGELLEVRGQLTRRTRTLVFSQCRAESDGKLVFTATAVQKIIAA
jgi:acyl-coenzyme A thioesterase PaaI-like protein